MNKDEVKLDYKGCKIEVRSYKLVDFDKYVPQADIFCFTGNTVHLKTIKVDSTKTENRYEYKKDADNMALKLAKEWIDKKK